MEIILRLIALILLEVYGCQMIAYSRAMFSPRYKTKLPALFLLLGLGLFAVYGFFDWPLFLHYLNYFALFLCFFSISSSAPPLHVLFAAGGFSFHLMIFRSIVLICLSLLFRMPVSAILKDMRLCFLSVILTLALVVITFAIYRKRYKDERLRILLTCRPQMRLLVLSQSFINLFLLMTMTMFDQPLKGKLLGQYHLGLCLMIFFLFYLLFDYCATTAVRLEVEMKAEILERQLNAQIAHYDSMSLYFSEFRKLRHDYKSLITGLSCLLDQGELEKSKLFLRDMSGQLQQAIKDYKTFSNNPLMQAMLLDCYTRCARQQIDFQAQVSFPEGFLMRDIDLCRIFGNLLSNAEEACAQVEQGDRFIRVQGHRRAGWMTFVVENSFHRQPQQQQNRLFTQKDNPLLHGIGIGNIQQLTEAWSGLLSLEPNALTKCFTVTLHFPTSVVMPPVEVQECGDAFRL